MKNSNIKHHPKILDYDALAATFADSLVTTLRGNRPEIDFLETWVPDSDPRLGITEMVDAAFEAKHKQISISVSRALLDKTALQEVVDRISKIANVQLDDMGNTVVLHVGQMQAFTPDEQEKSNPGDPSHEVIEGKSYIPTGRIGAPERNAEQSFVDERIKEIQTEQTNGSAHVEISLDASPSPDAIEQLILRAATYGQATRTGSLLSIDLDSDFLSVAGAHPTFRTALKARLENLEYEGELPQDETQKVVQCTRDGITISIAFSQGEETIHQARHSGAKDPLARAIFDTACSIMEGLPLREAIDHVGPHMLHTLRERTIARPVHGIMHTRNAGPWMHLPAQILRQIARDYRPTTQHSRAFSTYENIPSQTWRDLSTDQQKSHIEPLLAEYRMANGLGDNDMRLMSVGHSLTRQPVRIFILFSPDIELKDKPGLLFRFERYLKDRLEEALEVYHQEAMDKSVLRRMSATGT